MSDTASISHPSARFDWGNFLRTYSILFILLGMVILFGIITGGRFLQPTNLLNVVVQVAPIGIIGLGMMAAIITKGIDLSVGSTAALAAVVAASLAQVPGEGTFFAGLPRLPIFVSVIAALLVGTLVGGVVGSLVAIFRIPPFVATLGMMTAARGAANLYSDGRPISNVAWKFNLIGAGITPIFILVLAAVIMWFVLNRTRFGRHIYAIGGNEMAAKVSGISVPKTQFKIYALIGLLAGVAGIILTARTGAGAPTYGLVMELDVITAAVIGGTSFSGGIGTVWGVMAGTMIIGVINNGLSLMGVSTYWQWVVKGAIIVVAIIIDERKNRRR
ncbi:ABC transporter permease [Arachnia propionica]|uniref:ABC transporter permease n=1 Tax=Arachnia propionica TaxID=1750 RepID=A0A3P1T491_9ACTN|nr:ABC transporter permease [Arachnia propionica]MDO5083576.1 ABC transporter permease [Arachnia propionica]RRD04322.1 ABC transporter permease [Arachnia propionica]